MKVNSTVYKGIEFIEVSSLPDDQKDSLLEAINPEVFIKILMDGKMISRCLEYKYYEEWYDGSYRPSVKKEVISVPESRDAELKANYQV